MKIGKMAAVYPMVLDIGLLFMGKLKDHWNKKSMIFWRIFVLGVALFGIRICQAIPSVNFIFYPFGPG